jgi:penicillin-insensitive murein endopeptidase
MKNIIAFLFTTSLLIVTFISINGFSKRSINTESYSLHKRNTIIPANIQEYIAAHAHPEYKSKSDGKVSSGTLKYGYLLPYVGDNFWYFDADSYLGGRAFTNNLVYSSIIDSYATLKEKSNRIWCLMEASNQKGGKMAPHITHQNGLSIDFMMPLMKDQKPFYDFDDKGKLHYLMSFDDQGISADDSNVSIDFDAVGSHILALEKAARNNGLKIKKVIIKIEFKDELYASKYGKDLEESGIYFVKGLSNLVNALHDDHYHIDFEEV